MKSGGDRSGDIGVHRPFASHGCVTLADEASVQPDMHYLKTCSSAGIVFTVI
jgi:hypothetical protein